MATQPPAEFPTPTSPVEPTAPPPEFNPPAPDVDFPAPGTPSNDPAPVQPEFFTVSDPHSGTNPETLPEERDEDTRSDIEQAVESRSDAVERGEGGDEPETFTDSGLHDGVGGTGGVVKNQDNDAQ
jgi:hypothetical protein